MKPREPFIAWPGLAYVAWSTLCLSVSTLWFFVVYGGCDWVAAHRDFRVRVDFDWEQSIPFVPSMTLVYMSIYPMFCLVPLVLRRKEQVRSCMVTTVVMTSVAGVCFLLFPADLAYPAPSSAGPWQSLFDFADRLNLTHNLAPSLHVALSSLVALVLAPQGTWLSGVVLWTWAAAISVSTLLIHQHHVIDVLTGYALAAVCHMLVYQRLIRRPVNVEV